MNPSGISPFAKRANAAPASLDVAGGTLIDEDQIVFDHRKRVTPKPYGQRQLIKEQKELSTSKVFYSLPIIRFMANCFVEKGKQAKGKGKEGRVREGTLYRSSVIPRL